MAKPRPASKRTSKADTVVTNDSESRKASTEGADTPDITLPSLAQDYLQNKDEVMELLLKLTKALKEERDARQLVEKQLGDMQKQYADMQTHVEELQQTARQHAVQLPDAVRYNLDNHIEEMLEGFEDRFADMGVYKNVVDLERRINAMEEKLKDVKREQSDPLKEKGLVEEGEGSYLSRRGQKRIYEDSSDPIEVDMSVSS